MFTIKNIKISFKIQRISLNTVLKHLNEKNMAYELKSNYIILRCQFVFIIFKSKDLTVSHINVTKIGQMSDMDTVEKVFKDDVFNLDEIVILNKQIDNITAVYSHHEQIVLQKIIEQVKETKTVIYNREKFPGLFLRCKIGTLIFFHTGKVIAVGVKTEHDLYLLFNDLKAFLEI